MLRSALTAITFHSDWDLNELNADDWIAVCVGNDFSRWLVNAGPVSPSIINHHLSAEVIRLSRMSGNTCVTNKRN